MSAKKWVYLFGKEITEGNKDLRNLLGGKGANLAEMANLDIPVPPGFTVTTEACLNYYETGEKISDEIRSKVETALGEIEKSTGKKFGDANNPLLFSVRSGARVSMPGMMDTVLNLGLNTTTVEAIAKSTGNPRFAWDSYRRFIQMYSDVVTSSFMLTYKSGSDQPEADVTEMVKSVWSRGSLMKNSYSLEPPLHESIE